MELSLIRDVAAHPSNMSIPKARRPLIMEIDTT